jgi:predicted transcriptional regulator YheO
LLAAGLECDFGPLGTTVAGEREVLLPALQHIVDAALDTGADQVTAVATRGPGAGEASRRRMEGLLAAVADELGTPLRDLPRADKQRAVRLLEERGAFDFRRSPEIIAEALGVTRFTVYNYLNRER